MSCGLGLGEENEGNEDKIMIVTSMNKCVECFATENCPGCPVYGIIKSIRDDHLA